MSTTIMTLTRTSRLVPTWTMADRLRKARELTGLEQIPFAIESGISRATVSNAENGHSTPHRGTLALWSATTGVSLQWLETGEAPSDESNGAPEVPNSVRLKGLEPPTC